MALKIYFRYIVPSLINVRADDCFWPVTVVDVAISVPPTVVRITSVVSEARSPRAVCRSVCAGPGVTDTPLSAFLGNINCNVTRRWMGGAQLAEIKTKNKISSSQLVHVEPFPKLKTYDQKKIPEVNL